MSTEARTIGRSNISQSGSVVSGAHNTDILFDDGSLQHYRLAMFEGQHRLDEGTIYARLQHDDVTTTSTIVNDEEFRTTFYETRASDEIRHFDNTFNANK